MTFLNFTISLSLLYIIGIIISYFIFKSDRAKLLAMRIFSISLVTYIIFGIIAYYSYVNNDGFFLYPDQNGFFKASEYLGSLPDISSIFKVCFYSNIYIENKLAYFYFGIVGYFANNFLEGNTVFIQIINMSFLSSLIHIFILKILYSFVPINKAYRHTLVFIFLSYVFYYSPWLLRDIHISLVYAMGLSILFGKFSLKNFLILLLLTVITLFLRMEHGIFFMFIPLLYIYEKVKNKKFVLYLFYFAVSLLLFAYIKIIITKMSYISDLMKRYSEFTQNEANTEGLGVKLLQLPFGIKHIACLLYSQISPFPSWYGVVNGKDIFQITIGLVQMLAPFYWFIVWYTIVKSLLIKSFKKNIPSILVITFLITILFLLVNTANGNVRRIMCMYPVIYTIYVYSKYKMPNETKGFKKKGILLYLCLCMLYFVIKF